MREANWWLGYWFHWVGFLGCLGRDLGFNSLHLTGLGRIILQFFFILNPKGGPNGKITRRGFPKRKEPIWGTTYLGQQKGLRLTTFLLW